MKSRLATLAPTLPGLARARPVTVTTTLNNHEGDRAYLALCVTDASGISVGRLWMVGARPRTTGI